MKQQAVRRRIEFYCETWHALNQLGRIAPVELIARKL
jgi:hypothetical protein